MIYPKFLKLRVGNKISLSTTDLVSLGQCFAPTISTDHFDKLSSTDFRSSVSYFQGINFQPNQNWINKISTKIE